MSDEALEDAAPVAPDTDVVIVGGGVAGLVAARELVVGGLSVTLVEASDRLGGKAVSHTVADITLDAGAESFATRRGIVADYLEKIGLGGDIVAPNPEGAWLFRATGEPLPLPKASLLGIPGTPLAADVVAIVGFAGAMRAQLDSLIPGFIGSKEKTLAGLVRKRMGSAVLDRLVTPIARGVHSNPPEELDVDVVAPGLRGRLKGEESLAAAVRSMRSAGPAGSAVAGIRGGISSMISKLESDLVRFGVELRLNTRVSEVDALGVTLDDGSRLTARHVVLAAPDRGLSERQGGVANEPPIVLATLVVRNADLDPAPRGTGVLVEAAAAGITAKALTHASSKWPWLAERLGEHEHVLRLSYDSAALGERELQATALADASALLGVTIASDQLLGFARVEWAPPSRDARPMIEDLTQLGETVAGTGLAAVIAHSREESARIITRLSAPSEDF